MDKLLEYFEEKTMCIYSPITGKELKKKLKNYQDEIHGWKVLIYEYGKLLAPCADYLYRYGVNKAPKRRSSYIDSKGFHVFETRKGARAYCWGDLDRVRKVTFKKKDVVAYGEFDEQGCWIVKKLNLLRPSEGR